MKKLLVFLLCLLMAVSAFGVISASAEETSTTEDISALVTFNGYSVRTKDRNGIRAEFELDTNKLEALEEKYDVKIGMLFAIADNTAPDSFANYEKVTVTLDEKGELTSDVASVRPLYDNGYVGNIYPVDEETGKAKFFYTVTFKGDLATQENFNTDLYYRLYVILTDDTGSTVSYVDCKSSKFNYAVSLYEVAKTLVDLGEFDNPFVRSALSIANGNYEKYDENLKLLSKALSEYSIVIKSTHATYNETLYLSAARACAGAFEEALGVGLPIRYNTPDNEAAYIKIVKDTTLGKYAYEITAEDSVITVSASTVPAAAAGCEALAKAIAEGGYEGDTINGSIYSSYDYDSLYVPGAIYQIDFFDSKASMGNLVGGTFGHTNYYNYASGNFDVEKTTYFDDYIIGEATAKANGGTMQIVAPWTATSTWSVTDWEKSQTQYVYRENNYKGFQSKWQDKYLELGFGTVFELGNIKNKFLAEGSEYTLQLVASLNGSEYYDENGDEVKQKYTPNTNNNFMLGVTRIRPSDSKSSTINFGSAFAWGAKKTGTVPSTTPKVTISNRDVSKVNEYLVSVSGYYYCSTSVSAPDISSGYDPLEVYLGINAADYFVKVEPVDGVRDPNPTSLGGYSFVKHTEPYVTSDGNFKIGYNMNTHLYAVRVYGRVLKEEEIIQNHFADVAKYFKLDLTDFNLVTNDKDKNAIYALAAGITLDPEAEVEQLQKDVEAAIEKALVDGFTVTYGDGDDYVRAAQDGSFELPVPAEIEQDKLLKGKYKIFVGYKDANDELVTDASGKSLDDYTLTSSITVEPEYEVVDYSALYVQDNLMYHVSFLHAKEGATLENYGAASSGSSAYSAYELYEAEEANGAFYMESWKAAEDALVTAGTYYTGAPVLKDGYLRLGRTHEDGKFVSTPLRFSFNIDGTPAYYNSDYSVQVVSAACTDDNRNRPHNFFLGDFRVGFSYGIGGVESIQVRRKGISSNTFKETSFGAFFKTADEDSRSLNKQTTFKTTDAVTYTTVMDKDMADTDKTYVYKDADYGGTNTAFDGTSIDYAGRCTLQAYFGNIDMGGVKEHSTLGKNYYINNSLFTIAEGNPEQLWNGVKFYALRYYNGILEQSDIDQNNFADIAYAYLLDISAFNAADATAKTAVYTAFANKTIVTGFNSANAITKEAAQKLLDDTLAANQTPAN